MKQNKEGAALFRNRISLVLLVCFWGAGMLACSLVSRLPEPTPTFLPTETHLPTKVPVSSPEMELVEPTKTPLAVEKPTIEVTPVSPGILEVAMVHAYLDSYGSWVVAGLLVNNTDRALDDIEVEINALDSQGISLYSEVVYSSIYALEPGGSSPFNTWIWDELPGVEEFSASVVGFSPSDSDLVEVEIRNTWLSKGEGYVHLTGEVFNPTGAPVYVNNIAGATFDPAGALVTAGAEVVAVSYLDPGESGPFRITMDLPAEEPLSIEDFSVYFHAESTYEGELYDITFLETSDYFDSNGDYHLVGALQNNSKANLSISLLAAIYDESGRVLDADALDLPTYALTPGEQMFFDFLGWNPLNTVEGLSAQARTYDIQIDQHWTWETDTAYVDLAVSDAGFEYDSYWGLVFSGKIVNNTGVIVTGSNVIVVLRDVLTGNLVGMGYTTIYDEIPVASSVDYEITVLVDPALDLDELDYILIAKGELP